MDLVLVGTLIGQFGFPITCLIFITWYFTKYIEKQKIADEKRDTENRLDTKERELKLQNMIESSNLSNKLILESNHELMEANKIILETNKQLSEKIDLKLDFLIQINRNEVVKVNKLT